MRSPWRRCGLGWLWLALAREAASFDYADHSKAALAALFRAEELGSECKHVDERHVQAKKDPLVAACDSRPVFKQYLLALRHLMALFAEQPDLDEAAESGILRNAGDLDQELSQLTFAGKAAPFYFWHGPKRHVPVKMRELLRIKHGDLTVRRLLEEPPEGGPRAPGPALNELGLAYPKEARPADLSSPALRADKGADACAAGAKAAEAGIRHFIAGGPDAKDLLKPCLDASLEVTWDLGDSFSDIFETGSETPLQDALQGALDALQRPALDAVALPSKAWLDRRLKGYVESVLGSFVKDGKVKAVALSGAMPVKQLQKVLDSSLAPAFWLVPHDDCGPITPASLQVADKARLKVIGFGAPCGPLLAHVAKKEAMSAVSLWGRWTAELGLGVALPHSAALDPAEALRGMRGGGPLSKESWRLLSGATALSRTAALALAPDFEDTFGLKEVIKRAAEEAAADVQLNSTVLTNVFLPQTIWEGVQEDKAQFVDNHYIIYKDNFLTQEMYQLVQNEAERLWRSPELEPNCNLDGADRTGGYVLDVPMRGSSLYELFYGSEEFRRWVSRINGQQMFPSDFPLELREYPSGSTGMACHRDLLMYTNATLDLEFVYTIDNHGSCVSTYTNLRGETTEVHTKGNSLIMVRPNAAMHCVKPSTGGHRTILKFIYVGDYRKSSGFGSYTTNTCPEDNPNVQAVLARRSADAQEL